MAALQNVAANAVGFTDRNGASLSAFEARVQELRLILLDLELHVKEYEQVLLRRRRAEPGSHVSTLPDPIRLEFIGESLKSIGRGFLEDLGLRQAPSGAGDADFREKVLRFERDLIAVALDACGHNQRLAARSLGIQPSTLHEKMKRLGLATRRSPVD